MNDRGGKIVFPCLHIIWHLYPIFAQNFYLMEVRKKSKGLYWLLFFISTAALIFAIAAHWPWLTLILPFVTTFFVLAMDII
jgi:hypothetical protein